MRLPTDTTLIVRQRIPRSCTQSSAISWYLQTKKLTQTIAERGDSSVPLLAARARQTYHIESPSLHLARGKF